MQNLKCWHRYFRGLLRTWRLISIEFEPSWSQCTYALF